MGAYFSLHEAREWEQTVNAMVEPSIWSHASFSPLTRSQKVLLERPGRVEYAFHKGMIQGDDYFVISEASELSLLVCFEEKVGRLYSGVLLTAPEDTPHIYRQAVAQVSLKAPGRQENSMTMGSTADATHLLGGDGEEAPIPADPEARRKHMLFGSTEGRQEGTYHPLAASLARKAKREAQGHNEGDSGLEMDKMWQDGPMTETAWTHMLLYNVKEGVLCFLGNSRESCEEVIREIAGAFGVKPPPPTSDGSLPKNARKPAPGAADPGGLEVTDVQIPVGKVSFGSTTKKVADAIMLDLKRRFAVTCDITEQHDCTNCVIFCLRVMLELQLGIRGYDVKRACEAHANLGVKAGDAVAQAWEQMWVRAGGTKGFAEPLGSEGSRWHREVYQKP